MAFMGIFVMWIAVILIILGISFFVCAVCFIASAIIMKVKRRKSPGEKIKQPWYVIILRIIGGVAAIPILLCVVLLVYDKISNSIDKKTNLIRAAEQYDYEQVENILQKGADVDERDAKGNTLLMCIVNKVDYESKDNGISYRVGYDPFTTDTEENIEKKNEKLIQLLFQYGADINAKKESRCDISYHVAGNEGYNGIYANSKDDCGNTVLLDAVIRGTPEMVAFLIENGADVNEANACGFTPLLLCVDNRSDENGGAEILKLLLDAGADAHAISNFDQDAIWLLDRNTDEVHVKMKQQLNQALDSRNSDFSD